MEKSDHESEGTISLPVPTALATRGFDSGLYEVKPVSWVKPAKICFFFLFFFCYCIKKSQNKSREVLPVWPQWHCRRDPWWVHLEAQPLIRPASPENDESILICKVRYSNIHVHVPGIVPPETLCLLSKCAYYFLSFSEARLEHKLTLISISWFGGMSFDLDTLVRENVLSSSSHTAFQRPRNK